MVQTIRTLCWLTLFVGSVVGHMEMTWPYALRSKFNPKNDYSIIDYSNTSPLSADGSNFPCKGYQNDRPFEVVVELAAGSDHNLTLAGSATHNGGSCQISLSYDNGATFRVIKSIVGGCPLLSSYDFTIPVMAPSGNALLAWTWQNLQGNREFYMNCAQINIVAAATRRRRRQVNTFDSLPLIWKANLGSVNNCTTTEGKDVVYPNPGPAISYGNGLSDSSPPTPGACDGAEPYGETYKDLGDTETPESPPNGTPPPESTPPAKTPSQSPASESSAPHSPKLESQTPESALSQNTTLTISVPSVGQSGPKSGTPSASTNAMSFITVATLVLATENAASLTPHAGRSSSSISTHVPRSLAMSDYGQIKLAAMTTPSVMASTVTVTADDCVSTVTVTVNKQSQSGRPSTIRGSGASATSSRPAYATGDPNGANGYLPCVPGTFLCTSRTTWKTCNYNDGSVKSSMTWVWGYQRTVAAGMECLPNLSPYNDQTELQQSTSSVGSYRDDRYVRARPDGNCESNGSIQCTYGGYQFDICNQGGWVQMGSVAIGTICRDGKLIAA